MISGTIKASPTKLCTVIVLLRPTRIQKEIFKNMTYDVITKNNGKIRTSAKPDKLYITRKVMMRAFRKCTFIGIRIRTRLSLVSNM